MRGLEPGSPAPEFILFTSLAYGFWSVLPGLQDAPGHQVESNGSLGWAGKEKGQARSQVWEGASQPAPVLAQQKCSLVPATPIPMVRQMEGADSGRGQGPGPEQAKGRAGGSRWRQREQKVSGQDRSPGCSSALGASVSLSVMWWKEGHALIGSYFHGVALGKCQACLCLNFFLCQMGLISKSDCFWVDHQDRVRLRSA